MGKTPDALKLLSQRESSRDNWDRYMMDKAVEEVSTIMIDMVATKQEKPMKLELFQAEIKKIARDYPDINDLCEVSNSGSYAKVTVGKKEVGDTKYRYFIDSGSSMKKDDEKTHEQAMELMAMISQNQLLAQLAQQNPSQEPGKLVIGRKVIDVGELTEVIINTSGLPNASKIVSDVPDDKPAVQGAATMPAGAPQQPGQLGQSQPVADPVSVMQSFKDPAIAQYAAQLGQQPQGGGTPNG
jgi:hypothetical protein